MLTGPFTACYRHRELLGQLVVREVVGRYRGSFMGVLWSLLTPLLMLAVYTFVFAFVFELRWGDSGIRGDVSSKGDFAIMIFSGLIVHGFFAECIGRAPNMVVENPNFVKRIIFPLEILPLVTVGAALFHLAVSMAVLLGAFMVFYGVLPPLTCFLVPVILLPFFLLTIGLSWLFAALGVFVRDLNHTVNILITMALFLAPIFYSLALLPEAVRPYFYLNPITWVVQAFREVALMGTVPDMAGFAVYSAVSLAVFIGGYAWFNKARRGFADVL